MKPEALIILWTTLGIVFFSYVVLALKAVWEINREKKRIKAFCLTVAFADPDVNVDHGGGDVGSGTSE